MNKSVLVFAAHPDDEVLGCGATIAKHSKAGDQVNVVILAEGVTSRNIKRDRAGDEEELTELAAAAHQANKVLGVSSLDLHDFPDNRMDGLERLDVIKVVEKFIDQYTPDIIYTHHAGDVNIDHRVIHEAVVTACRPMPGSKVNLLLFFEIPSSTEWQTPGTAEYFQPNWFVDVSDTIEIKMKALSAYQSEMRPWPHPRSLEAVEHLMRWRGAAVGVQAAEAFVLGRKLVK